MSDLLLPADVASQLGITEGILARWRGQGAGPPYVMESGGVAYSAASVEMWCRTGRGNLPRHLVRLLPQRAPFDLPEDDLEELGR